MPTCDAAWLAAQRWYGAADRTIRSLRVVDAEPFGPGLSWQVVEVDFEAPAGRRQGDGAHPAEAAHYQLFWDEGAGDDAAHHPAAIAWLFADLFGGNGPGAPTCSVVSSPTPRSWSSRCRAAGR